MAIAKKTRRSTTAPRPTASKSARAKTPSKSTPQPDDGDDDAEGSGRSTPLGLDVDHEVLDFIEALERFKKRNNRPFPSWSEVLFVLKELGYRKS